MDRLMEALAHTPDLDAETADLDEQTPDPPPTVRLVRITVQLDVALDDGVTLTPLQVAPATFAPADAANLDVAALVADVQRQVTAGSG
jgi:hypothetical protein